MEKCPKAKPKTNGKELLNAIIGRYETFDTTLHYLTTLWQNPNPVAGEPPCKQMGGCSGLHLLITQSGSKPDSARGRTTGRVNFHQQSKTTVLTPEAPNTPPTEHVDYYGNNQLRAISPRTATLHLLKATARARARR